MGQKGTSCRSATRRVLADALAAIASNRDLRDRMSAAALRRAGEYSLEAVGNQLYQALLGIVGSRADG